MNSTPRPFTFMSALWLSLFLLVTLVTFTSFFFSTGTTGVSGDVVAAASGLVNLASFLIVSWYAFTRYGIELRLTVERGTILLALSTAAAAAGFIIVVSELDNIMNGLFPMLKTLSDRLSEFLSEPSLPLSILLVAVAAPVTEEIFFRGIILEGLSRSWSRGKAIAFASLMFALLHVNPVQITYTFVFGVLLGYVYTAYRSILPGVLIHAFINFLPILFTRIVPVDIPGFTDTAGNGLLLQPPLLDAAGVLLAAAGVLGMAGFFRKHGREPGAAFPGEPPEIQP